MSDKEMSDLMLSRFEIMEHGGILPKEFFLESGATVEVAIMLFAKTAREWGAEHGVPYLAKVTAEMNDEGLILKAELLTTQEEANKYKELLLLEEIGVIKVSDRWSEEIKK